MTQTSIHFFNTNKSGLEVLDYEISKAISLEDRVLEFFKSNPRNAFTWSEVMDRLDPKPNENSLKRSITNLMNRGLLIKTNDMAKSKYGKMAHRYRVDLDMLNFKINLDNKE